MPGSGLSAIEHVVVLMLENRSFDHMLGYLYSDNGNVSPTGQPFEGLTGTESNPDASGNPAGVFKIEPTTPNAYFMPGADPGEGYMATNDQLFGSTSAPASPAQVPVMQGFVKDFAYTLGWESHDSGYSVVSGSTASNIMGCFTPEALPVLSALARGYAVCDHWFCSAPTETLPNRAFANAATSQGHMDDKTHTYTSPSIFGLLSSHGAQLGHLRVHLGAADQVRLHRHLRGARRAISACSPTSRPPPRRARCRRTRSWSRAGDRAGTASTPTTTSRSASSSSTTCTRRCGAGPGGRRRCSSSPTTSTAGATTTCRRRPAPPRRTTTRASSGSTSPGSASGCPPCWSRRSSAAGTVFRVPAGSVPFDHTSILKTVEERWNLPPLSARDAVAPEHRRRAHPHRAAHRRRAGRGHRAHRRGRDRPPVFPPTCRRSRPS